jgi:3-oxoacyl-[acyl-carrier protein] reductase
MGVLDDKVAIITGSARGIGRATAELLASQGAKVVINDLDADLAAQTASEIDGETAVFGGDLTKGDAPQKLIDTAIDAWGKIDIIVNNAGYTLDGAVHKMTDENWDRMIDIHLTVPFKVIRAAAPYYRDTAKQDIAEGREVFRKIINVSSTSGVFGNAAQANYAAGKAGVVGLTKTLAKEWGMFKVNVNAVAYGFVETRLTASKGSEGTVGADVGGKQVDLGMSDIVRQGATMMTPLGRGATPEEAAGGVFFLASPYSNFVTGQTLLVSGGMFGGMVA